MQREPLDSFEYESTYLELQPAHDRPTGTTDAPILASRASTVQVDVGGVPSTGPLAATADISVAQSGPRRTSTIRPDLAPEGIHRPGAAHPANGPPNRTLRVAGGRCQDAESGHPIFLHRPLSRPPIWASLLVVVSASLGVVAELDQSAAQRLFVALGGILLLTWGRLAWRSAPRSGPFGDDISRALDRLLTALGTFFAVALWARYASHLSVAVSRTVVLALSGVGLIGGMLAAARGLLR